MHHVISQMKSSSFCARPEPRDVSVYFTVPLAVFISRWKALEKGGESFLVLGILEYWH